MPKPRLSRRPSRRKGPSDPYGVQAPVDAAWAAAERELAPALKRLGAPGLVTETSIVTRVHGGLVAHAPVRVQRARTFAAFCREPRPVAALWTTRSLVDRLTRTTLLPGAYVACVRQVGGDLFALDVHDAAGERVLATLARQKPVPLPAASKPIKLYGIDVDVDPPDDILNPFKHLICLSFLFWRTCFQVPPWIWPL